jgi:ketosteroid isomerase-like protein
MSRENVALRYRAADAFNRHDLDALLALCDPDVVFISRHLGLEGGGRTLRGHDGVRTWWESLLAVFPDFSTELEEVRDLGDVTVTRHQLHGRGIGSGAPMEQTNWDVTEWRHKKAIWWRAFRTEAEALEAAEQRD